MKMRFMSKLAGIVLDIAIVASAQAAAAPAPPTPATPPSQTVQEPAGPSSSSRQIEPVYHQGEGVLSAGLALGGINGSAGSMSVPPIFAGFDYGFAPDISVGALAAYYRATANSGFGADWSYSYTTVAVRGDYHFGKFVPVEKLDLYAGLLLGYAIVSVSYPASTFGAGAGGSSNILVWGANLGARYFFTKTLAAEVDLGVGLGNLSLGLAYKL
jgi:hypothetical protein